MTLRHAAATFLLLFLAQAPDAGADAPKSAAVAILEDEALTMESRLSQLQAMANATPEAADVWAAYGEALEQSGDSEKAFQAFEKATQLDPGLYTPWLWIGLLAKRGVPKVDLERAEAAFRKALDAGAPKPRTLNELGVTLAMRKDTARAMDCWREAVAADPGWGALYNNLIKGALQIGDKEAAKEYAEKAIGAERFEENAVMQYGESLMKRDRPKEAAAYYRKAVAARPESPRLRYYLGEALGASGEEDAAVSEFEQAITLAKKDPAAPRVAEVLQSSEWGIFRLKNPRDEKKFQEARKLIFQQAEDFSELSGDLKKAIKILDPLVQKHPGFWNGYFLRGVAQRRLDNREAARRDLGKVIELNANEPNATMELALLSRDEHEFDKAAELADKAVELAPRDPLFAINAGFIMLDAKKCDRARELYALTVKLAGEENAAPLKDELEIRCKK